MQSHNTSLSDRLIGSDVLPHHKREHTPPDFLLMSLRTILLSGLVFLLLFIGRADLVGDWQASAWLAGISIILVVLFRSAFAGTHILKDLAIRAIVGTMLVVCILSTILMFVGIIVQR